VEQIKTATEDHMKNSTIYYVWGISGVPKLHMIRVKWKLEQLFTFLEWALKTKQLLEEAFFNILYGMGATIELLPMEDIGGVRLLL